MWCFAFSSCCRLTPWKRFDAGLKLTKWFFIQKDIGHKTRILGYRDNNDYNDDDHNDDDNDDDDNSDDYNDEDDDKPKNSQF